MNICKTNLNYSIFFFFLEQCIDTEAMKYMNSKHIALLLTGFPLGIRIKFEKYIYDYQTKQVEQNYNPSVEPKLMPITPAQNIVSSNLSSSTAIMFDLATILTKSTQGSIIVDYYYKHKKLNELCRSLLVEIIINDLIKRNCTMTIDLANNIANSIVVSFPSEIKVRI